MKSFFTRDVLITAGVLGAAFLISLLLERQLDCSTSVPALFVLAVFLITLNTQGYGWGIVGSLISVLSINYAFTFPYFRFTFSAPENLISALVMLIVTVLTSTLTTKVKRQEKEKAEREKEKMRANLLRAISHDLRTPLTAIYGSCSAIMENYDRLSYSKQMQLLGEIRSDAQWLIRMVENLLSVTRIDGGQVRVIKTPIVLEELIDSVLLRFHKQYPQQKVDVDIPDEFLSIPMDAMLIEQVLMNLLENAVQHARGMNWLMIQVTLQKQQAIFDVLDNGAGIPREMLPHLFDGFPEKNKIPSDGKKRNMGIGLSVCASIIHAHGGTIKARNRPEGGADIRFVLDLEEKEHDQQ